MTASMEGGQRKYASLSMNHSEDGMVHLVLMMRLRDYACPPHDTVGDRHPWCH